jgi:hypothetical protein
MLNKKIVSLISALTMALSMCSFVSVQAADVPAADLEFKVEKNIFDQESFEAGYQEYTITVNMKTENIKLEDNGKAAAMKRYKGSRVTSFAGRIKFDNTVFYTDNSMIETKVSVGNPYISPYDEGITFNWYCGDYTTALEGESIELFKINLYGMNEEGDVTIDADADFESMFAWDTTNRSVSYCEWPEYVKASELSISSPKVLGDDSGEAGWVGNLGIEKDEPIPEPDPEPAVTEVVVSDTIDLEAGDAIGAAWDVTIKNFDSAKKYVTTFTDKDTEEVRENGYKELNLDAYAETEGDLGFAVILKLNAARNVALSIAIQ